MDFSVASHIVGWGMCISFSRSQNSQSELIGWCHLWSTIAAWGDAMLLYDFRGLFRPLQTSFL